MKHKSALASEELVKDVLGSSPTQLRGVRRPLNPEPPPSYPTAVIDMGLMFAESQVRAGEEREIVICLCS